MDFDVVIVGAGPAGLFSAYELITKKPNLRVCLIDQGKKAQNRVCPMKKTGKCVNCNPANLSDSRNFTTLVMTTTSK